LIDASNIKFLDRCRNLVTIVSIEGSGEITDDRRGMGVYNKGFLQCDKEMKKKISLKA